MIVRLCRYTDRALVALASIALTLNSIDRPREFWGDNGYLVGVSLAVLVVFGVAEPFTHLCSRKTVRDREQALRAGLDAMDDAVTATNMSMRELSVHVWVPRRTLRHPVRGVLKRPISLRVGYQTVNRPVEFNWNKGVVGHCWARNDEVLRNIEQDFHGVTSKADWEQLVASHPNDDFTMGLSFEEFERTRHLRAVVATPIRRKQRFAGCVSADTDARPLHDLQLAMPALRRYADELGKLDLLRVE